MFQGTSSNAGKSILTAALCRILLQDGYSVAPFKSQNMSLNSFVTDQGGEMGRAQVVQAQACRIAADVRMNPILLKPNSDTGSQVIVLGKPVGNMNVDAYIHYKTDIFATVKETYDSLAAEHDVIVLEGAGSPAEVNLKRHDIVNMRMARYAKSPVLLVGDIDRGGVLRLYRHNGCSCTMGAVADCRVCHQSFSRQKQPVTGCHRIPGALHRAAVLRSGSLHSHARASRRRFRFL